MTEPIRKLAAIMFTDIAGFTALSSQDEEAALKLLDQQREILKPIVAKHQGQWLKEIGDGLLLSFPSSKEAVNCAIEIQHILKEVKNLNLRIGIHQGDILEKDGDIFGDDVNIASRMEPFSAVGGVAISNKVAADISSSPEFKVKLIGEPKLKGVRQQVRIYCITSHGLPETRLSDVSAKLDKQPSYWLRYGAPLLLIVAAGLYYFTTVSGVINSIAVLPLENLSNDPEQEYFVNGMMNEMISNLSKIGSLRIISRTSAMSYKGTNKPLAQIARELGVDAVVEGSVLRIGNIVRITTQLIRAKQERNLWSETYDRDLIDILALHSDVARDIARKIKAVVLPEDEARLAAARRVNPEVYEAYLKGMFHLHKFTQEGFERGLAYLNEAIEIDPDDPLPYAGLAIGYIMIAHGPSPPPDSYDRAEETANKALALDPTISQVAEVYGSLAQIKLYQDWDWPGAERDFNLALELKPHLAVTRIHYGWYLILMDSVEQAIAEMKRAEQSDPLLPILPAFLGWAYWIDGRYDEALAAAQRALEINPDFPVGFYVLGLVYSAMGRYEESIEAHKKAGSLNLNWAWGLGHTYALAGQREEALKVAEILKAADNNWNAWGLAEIYITLNETDQAIHWIEEAYRTGHGYTPWIRKNPVFEPLIDDPRFQDIYQRLNLPE